MDWKELGTAIAKIGLPLLGAVLPIPGGAAIGGALANAIGAKSGKPEDILATLTQSAEAQEKAKEFELTNAKDLEQMRLAHDEAMRKADSQDIAVVNGTMVAELTNAQNEAWYQKAWRPACGFSVAGGSFASVCGAMFLMYRAIILHDMAALSAVPALASAVATILAVPGAAVGIAAWGRNKLKLQREGGAPEAK